MKYNLYINHNPMKNAFLFFLILLSMPVSQAFSQDQPTREYTDHYQQVMKRTQWWREARFGMFIHFGAYAVPARGDVPVVGDDPALPGFLVVMFAGDAADPQVVAHSPYRRMVPHDQWTATAAPRRSIFGHSHAARQIPVSVRTRG